jgi:hypothetical protein
MGKFKKETVAPELSEAVRWTEQAQKDQHSEYRDAGYDYHRRPRSSDAGFT